ncbi:hypothetical protein ACH5RR_024463 [Cinchona calisaya]|uniref:Non-haem dioxygenase N-terminal domain-containing protein n=1 Tax=Cinchona calisaya TaxID=153742 RepID=A0ABD2YWR0_9GENT
MTSAPSYTRTRRKEMALMTPESLPENGIIDFRAPPPSPVASGRRSSVTNEDVLSEFLETSLKVPDLILPDRVFPKQKSLQNSPKLDFQTLNSSIGNDSLTKFIDSVAGIGCFEVINHGIPEDWIKSVLAAGDGIFGMSQEKRKIVTRSLERSYGFEELLGEEEKETMSEEFVWCRDESLKMDMEGIWPFGYSNFSDKMEKLLLAMENVAAEILLFLEQSTKSPLAKEDVKQDREFGSICYLHKHWQIRNEDQSVNSLRYDVIRMLVKGSEFPHALCFHVCNGSEEFHVYSKKGWVSFRPDQDALVVTFGDQLQAWSRGLYKHVIGRPIFKGGADEKGCMSMAFLYSPQDITKCERGDQELQTISIGQQILVLIVFTLLYHVIISIFKFFK